MRGICWLATCAGLLAVSSCWAAQPVISEIMAINGSGLSDEDGDFSDWIEIHNQGTTTVDLAGWRLTDDPADLAKWIFPATNVGPFEFTGAFASDKDRRIAGQILHTNFKLSGSGEYLALVDPDANIRDEFAPAYPEQFSDVSYGRSTNPLQPLAYFIVPTPLAPNSDTFVGFLEPPHPSHERGFYTNAFYVSLTGQTAQAEVKFTLDGSTPSDLNGTTYTSPIPIQATTTLRAATLKPTYHASPAITHTYMFVSDIVDQSPNGEAPGPGWPDTEFVNNQRIDYGMDPNVTSDPNYTDLMEAALLSIPTLSIVTDLPNLFDPFTGIYVNAQQDGRIWERATSVELISTNASEGFQIDAGLRIRGGISRLGSNPKHSFRLLFRSEYGAGLLRYALFGDEGADEFDKIDLRTNQNISWHSGSSGDRNTMIRDLFSRDIQRDMGRLHTRSRAYHLYLNGHYWGIYQTQERAESNFAATYLGGEREDYDVMKVNVDGTDGVGALDGTLDHYSALWAQATAGLTSAASLLRIMGQNPDGTCNPNYPVFLDPINLIDYMITVYYTGDLDGPISGYALNLLPNNFYAVHNHTDTIGMRYLRHDAENTLLSTFADRTGPFENGSISSLINFTPQWLNQQLLLNTEYQIWFGDRVHKYFFNGGLLMPQPSADRFEKRATEIALAIIGESARWGDRIVEPPRTRDDDWLSEIQWLETDYFPQRTEVVLNQFKGQGWYPDIPAPTFVPHGGIISPGASLVMTAPTGTVFFTIDGQDPRAPFTAFPVGANYSGPISGSQSTLVKARAISDGNWSALTEAVYLSTNPSPLRITEIMYHPRELIGGETNVTPMAEGFEFVEFRNMSSQSVGFAGHELTRGIPFVFNDGDVLQLDPWEYVVVVRNLCAFTNRYPNWENIRIAGEFRMSGRVLSDAGETVEMRDGLDRLIQSIRYRDGWYDNTDGGGFSLTLRDEGLASQDWDSKSTWRASAYVDGSPGEPDPDLYPEDETIVINEVLSHQDSDEPGDWIELLNTTDSIVSIGDWYLSDDPLNATKLRIPSGVVIPAHGTVAFTEHDDFGTNVLGMGNGFALSELGECVVLSSGTNGFQTGYYELQEFGAAEQTVTFGRYVTSSGSADFPAMRMPTQGQTNANPLVGPIVISEIMYHPATPNLPEFVELHCIDAAPTPLYDVVNSDNTWILDGAVDFVMPTGIVLQAGEFILVGATNPAALRAAYPFIPPATRVLGPYIGKLDNDGERQNLSKPGAPEPGGFVPMILVDSVRYNDKPPWSGLPDGFGPSLERCDVEAYANDSANWRSGYVNGSPGTVADSDADGMDDRWEIFYFGNIGVTDGGPTADQDADGFLDQDEWLAGTDPTDAASSLSLEGIESDTNAVVVQWQSVSGQTYAIEFSTNVMGAPFMMTTGGIAADPPLNTFTSDAILPQPGFFRILVE